MFLEYSLTCTLIHISMARRSRSPGGDSDSNPSHVLSLPTFAFRTEPKPLAYSRQPRPYLRARVTLVTAQLRFIERLYNRIDSQNSLPSGIWSIWNDTEKISMAPALRMTRSIKEKQPFFCIFSTFFIKSSSKPRVDSIIFTSSADGFVG